MVWIFRSAIVLILVAITNMTAHAAPATVDAGVNCSYMQDWKLCTFTMKIDGEIDASTVKKVREGLAEVRAPLWLLPPAGYGERFEINSPGGSVDAAIEIGRMLRKIDAPVFVEAGASCISACVLILAGATSRQINGRVGIHRPYLINAPQPLTSTAVQGAYDQTLQSIRLFLREMNVGDRLADDMVRIVPEQVRFLTASELDGYGLGERDPVYHETLELAQAQKYGLDRREYMRRKALVDRECVRESRLPCRDRIMKTGQ